ncbi:NfeD family protein [Pseudoxanthomonas suwonensis]|uniref:Membrane protein n=1 Tax=Pseudoxanthomonas suwonensis TaxID=314722 RepID=A0A0E3UM99_9GAMM|nr:NfeD family protein [Pseudoxanthomonas suwonensis]AKC86151.1 membrane protein [Pseudoxanthomonas suwonensis]
MRVDVVAWAALALLLIAAETLAPGAFLLWMGFAAVAVFLAVLLVPDIPVLAQVAAFVVLSFVSIQVYRRWFRKGARQSDQPLLNRRAEQTVGLVAPLDQAIVAGRGRVKLGDAFWVVEGPDLPAGTPVRVVAVNGMVLKVQEA